jgi:hypothetical protein
MSKERARPRRAALATKLDLDAAVRAKLIERVASALRRKDIPVMVLHQLAQCLEMWNDDRED